MELQLSLHNIETGLRELYGMREEADTVEELSVIDTAIRDYITAEIRKADSISDFVLILERLAGEPKERKIDGVKVKELCEIDQEIERLKARRTRFRKIRDSVLDTCKFVMAGMDWKPGKPRKIDGVRHTISLRGNGGKQAVVVTDESMVPDEYCLWEGNIHGKTWNDIAMILKSQAIPIRLLCPHMKRVPSKFSIADALSQGKDVPGARLEERSEHVVIS